MFVRVNTGLKGLAGHPEYPFQVGIAVPLREPRPDGLPNQQESQELSDIENRLVRELEADRESILAATITTDGMREFVFYTCDWESMKGRFEIIEREVTSHQLQMIVQRDPDWKVFLLLAN